MRASSGIYFHADHHLQYITYKFATQAKWLLKMTLGPNEVTGEVVEKEKIGEGACVYIMYVCI